MLAQKLRGLVAGQERGEQVAGCKTSAQTEGARAEACERACADQANGNVVVSLAVGSQLLGDRSRLLVLLRVLLVAGRRFDPCIV